MIDKESFGIGQLQLAIEALKDLNGGINGGIFEVPIGETHLITDGYGLNINPLVPITKGPFGPFVIGECRYSDRRRRFDNFLDEPSATKANLEN